jgi:tetratricopeptide (TPR) repeat protein
MVHAETCAACRAAIVVVIGGHATGRATTATTVVEAAHGTRRPGELLPGTLFDRYVIEDRLGAGAMGMVYAARDPELDRRVAIKLLHPGRGDAQRLSREAQALARVTHPNVVAVHDVGTREGDVFIAMELVRGQTLRAWLGAPRSLPEILDKLGAAGRGLAAAHAAGLVHRDFKPENVLVGDDDRARVTDFGLARANAEDGLDGTTGAPQVGSPLSLALTETGTLLGTPVYSSPEQLAGERVGPAGDQFSFCVTAYEALYGIRPFEATTLEELVRRIAAGELAPPPAGRRVPARVHRAVLRGLRADPAERYPSMEALLGELAYVARRRAPWLVAGATVIAGTAVVIALVATRSAEPPGLACDSRAALAGVWDADVAAKTRKMFDDDHPGSPQVYEQFAARVDRYTADWVTARDQVCAGHGAASEAELAPRAQCLDASLAQLAGSIQALATDRPVPARLYREDDLVPVVMCTARTGNVPSGPEAAIVKQVVAVRIELGQVRAQRAAGRTQRARDLLAGAVSHAGALGYQPLQAEVAEAAGNLAADLGELDEAAAQLRRAITLAELTSYDQLKAEALVALVEVLVRQGLLDEAGHNADLAEAATSRIGGDLELEADLLVARAHIATAHGQLDAAIELVTRALARRGSLDADLATAPVLMDLANLYVKLGKPAEARTTLTKIGAIYAKDAPWLQDEMACQGALQAGDLTAARVLCLREVANAELSFGPEDVRSAEARVALAMVNHLLDDFAAARDDYARGAAVRERHGDRIQAAAWFELAGLCSIELRDFAGAVGWLRHSIELATGTDAPAREQLAFSRAGLGRALVGAGSIPEAVVELEWALPRLDALDPPANVGTSHLALAEALWRRNRKDDRDRARAAALATRDDAIARRDKLGTTGLEPVYRRRMAALVVRADAWLAHPR